MTDPADHLTTRPPNPGPAADPDAAGQATPDELARFSLELRRLRREAGDPSYRYLSRITKYSSSSIARALSGNRLPTWDLVAAFVTACNAEPETWRPRWLQVADLVRPIAPDPAETSQPSQPGPSPPPGRECPDCGAWVTNTERHNAWHQDWASRNRPWRRRRDNNPP